MEIIKHSRHVTVTEYRLCFDLVGASRHCGMVFDCDKDGNVDMADLEKRPAALDNYRKCLSGEHDVEAPYLWKLQHSYREPALGRCQCGCTVELDRFTNTCDGCSRDYNSGGQLLAHRSQWGEETGETYADLQDL